MSNTSPPPQLSIIIPTIRTHLLKDLYESIVQSCGKYSFEVIFVGPFDIPDDMYTFNSFYNPDHPIVYIKDFGQPSRAAQIGGIEAKGKLICWVTDDCFCYPNTLSQTIDSYNKECIDSDVIGMRFFENPDHYKAIKSGQTTNQNPKQRLSNHPDHYWYAAGPYGHLQGVQNHWGTACLFMMNTHAFKMCGGWDCQWEHLNHSTHDLLFRLQQLGSRFLLTDYDVFVANWYEGTSKDHAPVHYGQLTHDQQLFSRIWGIKNNRGNININNWQDYPEIWERRFGQSRPQTYTDLYEQS